MQKAMTKAMGSNDGNQGGGSVNPFSHIPAKDRSMAMGPMSGGGANPFSHIPAKDR